MNTIHNRRRIVNEITLSVAIRDLIERLLIEI